MNTYNSVSEAIGLCLDILKERGSVIKTERWQAMDLLDMPGSEMVEVLNLSLSCPIPQNKVVAAKMTQCNMPWAENHFRERVCGHPINPGKEWENWPWAKFADKSRENQKFNHNYMERMWPRRAGFTSDPTETVEEYMKLCKHAEAWDKAENRGIYHRYGDYQDVIDLLAKEPLTRQAYLPIWFPEDTGVAHEGRKPCTLGYHFIMRDDQLHVVYYIRSCDALRHFRDDIYLTMRLVYDIIDKCSWKNPRWKDVTPGTFTMHITSFHCFINDYLSMFKRKPNP